MKIKTTNKPLSNKIITIEVENGYDIYKLWEKIGGKCKLKKYYITKRKKDEGTWCALGEAIKILLRKERR